SSRGLLPPRPSPFPYTTLFRSAMMIGPQHIDRPSEAALVLLPVIRDVGQQIGVRAIGLAEHPVLVDAERRGPEPQRAILLVGVRSEEHTSELQSLRHLVCRLLL